MTVFYSATLDHKSRFRSDFFFKYSALNLVYITLRRQLTPPPLVSLRNDFWGTTADIPYWWRVTTQIWVRVLIGWKFYLSNPKHNTDLVVAFISMEFLRSFPRRHFKGNHWWRGEISAVFSGYTRGDFSRFINVIGSITFGVFGFEGTVFTHIT